MMSPTIFTRATITITMTMLLMPPSVSQTDQAKPRWQWTTKEVLGLVNQVRAGRSLQPSSWPQGAKIAVLLSFDVDTETLALMYGGPTIGELSQGEYGVRAGLPRILAILDRYGIPASFFVPAVSFQLHPEAASQIMKSGRHEIGVHGWIHETNSKLEKEEEREFLQKAIGDLTKVTGQRPVGYRAPSWNFSPNTAKLLKELGFLYDSSLMADDRPYELLAEGKPTGIIELPVEWILDDYPLLHLDEHRYSSPREVLQVYIDEFDKAYEEGTMFLLTMHPQVIGHRSRIIILEELLKYVWEKQGIWFATHREAAEYVWKEAESPLD